MREEAVFLLTAGDRHVSGSAWRYKRPLQADVIDRLVHLVLSGDWPLHALRQSVKRFLIQREVFDERRPSLSQCVEILGFVVGRLRFPALVKYSDPLESQRTHGDLVRAPLLTLLPIVSAGPERFVDSLSRPFDKGLAQERWTL